MRAEKFSKKSNKSKRLAILCSICGTAALSLCLVAASPTVSGRSDAQNIAQPGEANVTKSAVAIPSITEEETKEKDAPTSSEALSPDSGEQMAADF
jgi:hypothetical protein